MSFFVNQRLWTRNCEPETVNQKLWTKNCEPETVNTTWESREAKKRKEALFLVWEEKQMTEISFSPTDENSGGKN